MTEQRLIYISNNRIPTEKAHGLQIVQMCEAFVETGYAVTLLAPRRINTPAMRAVRSLEEYYGVKHPFEFLRLWCVDLFSWFPRHHIAFLTQTFTYLLALALWLLPRQADVVYTRDVFVAALVTLLRPRLKLAYEVHQLRGSRLGRRLETFVMRRAWVIPLTGHLADAIQPLDVPRIHVEHDGMQLARFANLPNRADARAALGLPPDALVVGYVGQLHTMGMSKGVDTVIEGVAAATRAGCSIDLLVVGGPPDGITLLRQQWETAGLDMARLHTVGQVPPTEVPRYLAAMDIGTLPLPWTQHFAYYASALKLFEYMAAGCVVIASDLPSTAEVVTHEETALLVPPGDANAFAAAIETLDADRALLQRISANARATVQHYAWDARAQRIRAFIEGNH